MGTKNTQQIGQKSTSSGTVKARLAELMDRASKWPEDAQRSLLEVGLEIEAIRAGSYRPDADELAAIDEGLAQLDRGEVASEAEVRKAFATFRRASSSGRAR